MKTKTYIFLEKEILILREALTDYYHQNKANNNQSLKIAKALKEQFKADCILF